MISSEAKDEEIIYRARALSPDYPGLLDFPLWEIGKELCHARHSPRCADCSMEYLCPRVGEERR